MLKFDTRWQYMGFKSVQESWQHSTAFRLNNHLTVCILIAIIM